MKNKTIDTETYLYIFKYIEEKLDHETNRRIRYDLKAIKDKTRIIFYEDLGFREKETIINFKRYTRNQLVNIVDDYFKL